MLKIGITGGIGSGKSTVAQLFAVLGVPVYTADDAAKRLMNESTPLIAGVKKLFGEAAYTGEQLNRKYIADIVFSDPGKLERLNALVHPVTLKDADDWMLRQHTPYAIKEAALMFESGAHEHLDCIIGVSAPVDLRIKRAMARDNISREEVMKRINRQMDENIKIRLCDYVIYNDEQQLLIPQVTALHQQLIELAG